MDDYRKSVEKFTGGMPFTTAGGVHYDCAMHRQLRAVIFGWMNGHEKDRDFHRAVNALEDWQSHEYKVSRLCDDLRVAAAIHDPDARQDYIEYIRPRVVAVLGK